MVKSKAILSLVFFLLAVLFLLLFSLKVEGRSTKFYKNKIEELKDFVEAEYPDFDEYKIRVLENTSNAVVILKKYEIPCPKRIHIPVHFEGEQFTLSLPIVLTSQCSYDLPINYPEEAVARSYVYLMARLRRCKNLSYQFWEENNSYFVIWKCDEENFTVNVKRDGTVVT